MAGPLSSDIESFRLPALCISKPGHRPVIAFRSPYPDDPRIKRAPWWQFGGTSSGTNSEDPPSITGVTVTATYEGIEIARSDRTVVVEGNHYFPVEDVKAGILVSSETRTMCPWKGVASYYEVVVGEHRNPDAAWYYPTPKDAAKEITDRVAFWKGIKVSES
jgi:uncharacterized protein (DUF427 family)